MKIMPSFLLPSLLQWLPNCVGTCQNPNAYLTKCWPQHTEHRAPFSTSYKGTIWNKHVHLHGECCKVDTWIPAKCFMQIGNGQNSLVERTPGIHTRERNLRIQATASHPFHTWVLLQVLPTLWYVTNQISQAREYPSLQEHPTCVHTTQKALQNAQQYGPTETEPCTLY